MSENGVLKKWPFQRADVGPGAREMVCAAHQGWCGAQIPMSFPKFPDVIQGSCCEIHRIFFFFFGWIAWSVGKAPYFHGKFHGNSYRFPGKTSLNQSIVTKNQISQMSIFIISEPEVQWGPGLKWDGECWKTWVWAIQWPFRVNICFRHLPYVWPMQGSLIKEWWIKIWLVLTGTMEFIMTFHSVGNFIIPPDSYFSEG